MKPAAASGTAPVVARLPRTLVSVQKKWMMGAGPERESVYVEEFAPAFEKYSPGCRCTAPRKTSLARGRSSACWVCRGGRPH